MTTSTLSSTLKSFSDSESLGVKNGMLVFKTQKSNWKEVLMNDLPVDWFYIAQDSPCFSTRFQFPNNYETAENRLKRFKKETFKIVKSRIRQNRSKKQKNDLFNEIEEELEEFDLYISRCTLCKKHKCENLPLFFDTCIEYRTEMPWMYYHDSNIINIRK